MQPYSEKTAETIDAEVKNLIDVQYERAKTVLRKNKKGLTELAEILLEKEVIFSDDLEVIFGKRPWTRHEELPKMKKELPKKKKELPKKKKEFPKKKENNEPKEA